MARTNAEHRAEYHYQSNETTSVKFSPLFALALSQLECALMARSNVRLCSEATTLIGDQTLLLESADNRLLSLWLEQRNNRAQLDHKLV